MIWNVPEFWYWLIGTLAFVGFLIYLDEKYRGQNEN